MMLPISYKPTITQQDVVIGKITRYFTYRLSSNEVVEIDSDQYNLFKDNPYYVTVKLPWVIRGNLHTMVAAGYPVLSVEEQNRRIVNFYSNTIPQLKRKLRNLTEYFVGIEQTEITST